MPPHPRTLLLASVLLPLAAPPAHAEAAATDPVDRDSEIIVTAVIPRSHTDILGGTSVLSGQNLMQDLRPNIGETLARQPGVSATSFGPNASRPILRGFAGDRIRLLTDGIGSFDVSATSVDHAVAINPLLADRIEVLHGPAALLYGSSAVGGVVNMIDTRIPIRVPDGPVSLAATGTYGSAANERSAAGRIDVPLGNYVVAHADGSYSRTGDLRTGGAILSPALRAEAAQSEEPEIRDLAGLGPDLPNSAAESWNVGGGIAFIKDGGTIGVAVSRLHNLYGVPVRYSLDPEGEAEHVRIRMDQTRADLRAKLPVNGALLDHVNLRAGWAGYRHDELEEDGSIGTTFRAQGLEGRLELVQARRGGWDGAIGAQIMARRAAIEGEEKFLPTTNSETYGLFTLQSFDLGDLRLEAGGRYEHSRVSAIADAQLGTGRMDRRFDTLSGSLGASYRIVGEWRIGLAGSRSERAPTADELFARGNHAGTQAFELGDPDFGTERGWGVEATLHGSGPGYHLGFTGYYNRFNGFIFDRMVADDACMAANGGAALEFPCFQFSQARARYLGFEAQGDAHVGTIGGGELHLDAMMDYVRATLTGYGPAPRIPPLRVQGGLGWEARTLTARVEVEHDFAQKRVAGLETPTGAFTFVNASLSWRPTGSDRFALLLSGNNLFDVVARRHASMLKDYAPLAGRDIRLTASVKL